MKHYNILMQDLYKVTILCSCKKTYCEYKIEFLKSLQINTVHANVNVCERII